MGRLRQCSTVRRGQKLVNESEKRVSADPSYARARSDFSGALAELAAVFRDSDPHRAEKLYARALDQSATGLQPDPEDADLLKVQSSARIGFAGVLRRLARSQQALTELNSAVNVAEGLVKRDSANVSARQLLGVALRSRAQPLLQTGDLAGAEKDLQRAQEILDLRHQENSANLLFLRELAGCDRVVGDLAAKRSAWNEAARQYQASLQLWEKWTTIGKSTVIRPAAAPESFHPDAARHCPSANPVGWYFTSLSSVFINNLSR